MSLFENFTAFNFNEGAPYITVTKNGAAFNKSVIMKLNYPTHVLLLINAQQKQIAIKVCSSDTPNATKFFNSDKKGNSLFVRWNARDLLNTLKDITGWDYTKAGYKVLGTLIPEENAMLFDLNTAEILN